MQAAIAAMAAHTILFVFTPSQILLNPIVFSTPYNNPQLLCPFHGVFLNKLTRQSVTLAATARSPSLSSRPPRSFDPLPFSVKIKIRGSSWVTYQVPTGVGGRSTGLRLPKTNQHEPARLINGWSWIKMAMEGGGGGTLSELYQRSKRLLLTTRDGLERLERLEFSSSNSGVDSPELSFSVKRDIGQIQLLCVEMDRLWRSIAAKSQRDLWKSGDGGGLWRCRGGAAAAWMQQVLRGHSGGGNLRAEMRKNRGQDSLATNLCSLLWKKIWHLKVPPRLKHFLWRIIRNAVATKENLFARKCARNPMCEICGDEIESIEHVLFRCEWTEEVWANSGVVFPSPVNRMVSIKRWMVSLVEDWGNRFSERMGAIAQICWAIWKQRNE
ncbi:hypothetical protein RHSIM_Rhsim02G0194700 [Rhododendron simsii]|uniref:Reverse transcriptase zinc-binding domain-containing protein n=1 Tax=Rhododendron simsii TaxID=118357 RepID=A0A834HBH5_RHOSS|nr:hypothetical protein RHSIM_Rhsim02G0194700 [Rhododendron simsii]